MKATEAKTISLKNKKDPKINVLNAIKTYAESGETHVTVKEYPGIKKDFEDLGYWVTRDDKGAVTISWKHPENETIVWKANESWNPVGVVTEKKYNEDMAKCEAEIEELMNKNGRYLATIREDSLKLAKNLKKIDELEAENVDLKGKLIWACGHVDWVGLHEQRTKPSEEKKLLEKIERLENDVRKLINENTAYKEHIRILYATEYDLRNQLKKKKRRFW